jgi:hypothetical protein
MVNVSLQAVSASASPLSDAELQEVCNALRDDVIMTRLIHREHLGLCRFSLALSHHCRAARRH